jgi:hypothetical protein
VAALAILRGRRPARRAVVRMSERSNKGMKLTKPERIGALQLIPGVRQTLSMRSDMASGARSIRGEERW